MNSRWLSPLLAALFWMSAIAPGLADGKVFARPEVQAKVEIPNQQALIYHANGVECLVIETAFHGEGSDFAWVVPLPGEPKVQAVSEGFFAALQQAFQPRLFHFVHHYYVGILFVLGLAFLGWRSLRDEVAWTRDLPLCLVLAVGMGLFGKSLILGSLTLAFALGDRLLVRSTVTLTVVVLAGMLVAVWVTAFANLEGFGLVQTMSADDPTDESPAEVTVLSVQHAGVFDSTTIRGTNPHAILAWLETNGFAAPKSIEPAVRDYVKRGWVFVASKVRRESALPGVASVHPLAFAFATPVPVYPLKLTGVENGNCEVALYVFGDQRATAPRFQAVRCDRLAISQPDQPAQRWNPWLRIQNTEVLNCVSNATVGTKLSATLTPKQMNEDTTIGWRRFSSKGANVYSQAGATTVALNVGVPLAAFGWLLVGASRGGWGVDEKFVTRWRWRVIAAALLVGGAVFWLLPKVEIVSR